VLLGNNGDPISQALLPQYLEFLSSVSGGEVFTFDRFGTVAAPVSSVSVQLESDSWAPSRIGGTLSNGVYKIPCKFRDISS